MKKAASVMRKSGSIRRKMLTPMALAILVQTALFSGVVFGGGTIRQLNQNAVDILNERVINRKSYLENDMLQRWSNLEESFQAVNRDVAAVLQEKGAAIEDVQVNSPLASEVLAPLWDDLIYLLRKNSVTGAFVVLAGPEGDARPEEHTLQKAGLYIRDMDPESTPTGTSDLLVERAPSALVKHSGLTMDTGWNPQFQFTSRNVYDFFYKPYAAALANPGLQWKDLGYWSLPFRLSEGDIEIITYSVPLMDGDGRPYGVLGVEVSLNYLWKLLPYKEIDADKRGMYLLAVEREESPLVFQAVTATGPVFQQLGTDYTNFRFSAAGEGGSYYHLKNGDDFGRNIYGCVQYIQLYNTNTPFEGERWALVGMMESRYLQAFSRKVTVSIVASLAVSLGLGFVCVIIASLLFARPVKELVREVKESSPLAPLKLMKTRITEFDELAAAIEKLSVDVADSASKLSRIIQLAGVPMGAFEHDKGSDQVFCAGLFTELILGQAGTQPAFVSIGRFQEYFEELEKYLESEEEEGRQRVYKLTRNAATMWVRVSTVEDDIRVLGVVADVTGDMLEKRKIEYERDYDVLTTLLNRRAFYNAMTRKFEKPQELGVAALVMLDLDNLKYINDTYGHDYGDEYIRCTAGVLKRFSLYRSLISRMSRDEFYLFLYGFEDKEEVRRVIRELQANLEKAELPLPGNEHFRVRASAGVAWYPTDAQTYEELIRYADFAMYKVKNTVKGEFHEFDWESYQRDSYLLRNKEELNKLIEEELVDYYFQPIVSAVDGSVFGYEALMRSRLKTIRSPLEIITLARSQSKLYQIEHLTWFKALSAFLKSGAYAGGTRIFVNSIPNQMLSERDIREIENLYAPLLSQLVIELTEEEKIDERCIASKQDCAARWQANLAMDDFGTGYNGESMLLFLSPHFVKIDISIIHGIDSDPNRRQLLSNLLEYAHERNIQVIAEGVETREEMETVVRAGVDYLQGYYIGTPAESPGTPSANVQRAIQSAHTPHPTEED